MQKIFIFIIVAIVAKWYFSDPSIEVSNAISFKYSVEDGGNSKVELPMLIALHGNGDTMSNFYDTALDKYTMPIRIILIEAPSEQGSGYGWPWQREEYLKYGDTFNEVVMALVAKFPTIGKPALMGFSGGGMMAYYQAYTHGNTYSYIFPISGNLSKKNLGDSAYDAPFFQDQ